MPVNVNEVLSRYTSSANEVARQVDEVLLNDSIREDHHDGYSFFIQYHLDYVSLTSKDQDDLTRMYTNVGWKAVNFKYEDTDDGPKDFIILTHGTS